MNLTIALAEGAVGTLEVEVANLTPERSSNPHDLFDLSQAKVAVALARVVNHEAPPPFLGARCKVVHVIRHDFIPATCVKRRPERSSRRVPPHDELEESSSFLDRKAE